MKLYEVEHINETYNKNTVMGMELKFVSAICPLTGKKLEPWSDPSDWDHVKRLTNMLFLAWNDSNPVEGTVYLGEWVSTKSEEEQFYDFFKSFNGYSINKDQKFIHECFIRKTGHSCMMPRRVGKTVYLSTLAVWLKQKGKQVHYAVHNHDMARLIINSRSYNSRDNYHLQLCPVFPVYKDSLGGKKLDWILVDEIEMLDQRSITALVEYEKVVPSCQYFAVGRRL